MELKLIHGGRAPSGTRITSSALVPKIMAVIEGDGGSVYVGGEVVRTFKHSENALLKADKVRAKEMLKASNVIKKLGFPTLTVRQQNKENKEIGFDLL